MNDTVDEVIRVATAEGIDADVRAGGELTIARSPAQLAGLPGGSGEQSWSYHGCHRKTGGARSHDRVDQCQPPGHRNHFLISFSCE